MQPLHYIHRENKNKHWARYSIIYDASINILKFQET